MIQGDFNHMANIITVLFEQIIANNAHKASVSHKQSTSSCESRFLVSSSNMICFSSKSNARKNLCK